LAFDCFHGLAALQAAFLCLTAAWCCWLLLPYSHSRSHSQLLNGLVLSNPLQAFVKLFF